MKKFARIIITLLGGAMGMGLLYLVFSLLATLGISDIHKIYTSSGRTITLAVYYGLCAIICMALFFLAAPSLSRWTLKTIGKIENSLAQVPLLDVLLGVLGLMVGLIIAFLLSTLISQIRISVITIPLTVIVYFLMAYLGVAVAVKRKPELRQIGRRQLGSMEETDDDSDMTGAQAGRRRSEKTSERSLRNIPPKILDTSVIIDGRIYDIAKTGALEGWLIAPSFVLQELRHIADSSDSLRRQRGRRGLDILEAMRSELNRLQVVDKEYPNMEVDEMLIVLAKEMKGKIITTDYNLNKVATVKGVEVININQLANALKPAVMPGEEMTLQIIRSGKEQGQGVAYLDDGTMIVVDGGRDYVGQTVDAVVTSVLQTAAGRMVFAKMK